MAYILGLAVLGLLFLALHYFTELTHSQKIIVASIFGFAVFGAYSYNVYNTLEDDAIRATVQKYKQGETLKCKGIDVNSSTFDLSGTNVFIGKKKTPHYSEIIRAAECK